MEKSTKNQILSIEDITEEIQSLRIYRPEDHPNPALGLHKVHRLCLNLIRHDIALEGEIRERGVTPEFEFDFTMAIADLLGIPQEDLDDDEPDYYCRDWIWSERNDVLDGKQSIEEFLGKLIKEAEFQKENFPQSEHFLQ